MDGAQHPHQEPRQAPRGGRRRRPGTREPGRRSPRGRGDGAGREPVQDSLFEPLPFRDEADEPVPFALTARARREVAPEDLPSLTVLRGGTGTVDDGGDLDAPGDTRPARARALRRAGLGVQAIAEKLDTDELTVRAWVGDVVVHPRARRPGSGGGRRSRRDAAAPRVQTARQGPADGEERTFELARASARQEIERRLETDAAFAAGLGLVAALAQIDPHAVTAVSDRQDVAARAVAWFRDELEVDTGRIRVILRVGSGVAGDLARHGWAGRLELPVEQVSHTRWRGAVTPDRVEALVRVADPVAAATLAGWCDALLAPDDDRGPADVAF